MVSLPVEHRNGLNGFLVSEGSALRERQEQADGGRALSLRDAPRFDAAVYETAAQEQC